MKWQPDIRSMQKPFGGRGFALKWRQS